MTGRGVMRRSDVFLAWIVVATAVVAFVTEYIVQGLEDQLVSLEAELAENHETINVLKAEWSYLNRPVRLAELSQRYLDLVVIIKPQPISLNENLRVILSETLEKSNSSSHTLMAIERRLISFYNSDSSSMNLLLGSRHEFEMPISETKTESTTSRPNWNYPNLDGKPLVFYGYTILTPEISMRVGDISSHYLILKQDTNNNYFVGANTYKMTIVKNIRREECCPHTVIGNQIRLMFVAQQIKRSDGSQDSLLPATETAINDDRSTPVYFAPELPSASVRQNWIQTDPYKGWVLILRLL